MGSARIYEKTVNIVITTPNEEYTEQQNIIEDYIEKLGALRNKSKFNFEVDGVMEEFKYIARTIADVNKVVLNTPWRQRREAIFPKVGSTIEWLIGSASEDTITNLKDNIANVKNQQNLISYTLFNHTSATIRTIKNIQLRNEEIDKNIRGIIHSLNDVINTTEDAAASFLNEVKIGNLIHLLTLGCMRYKHFQTKIFNSIMANTIQFLDPEIVPFDTIHEALQKLDVHQLKEEEVRYIRNMNEEGYILAADTIPMKLTVKNGCIYTELIIPILNEEEKEIYEAIPAPSISGKFFLILNIEESFFITNRNRSEIAYIPQSTLDKCWKSRHGESICPQTFVMYQRNAFSMYCELAILSNTTAQYGYTCAATKSDARDLFMKLSDNEYYFAMTENCHININCNGNITHETLYGTGIITIKDGCSVYNKNIRIIGNKNTKISHVHKYTYSNYTPPIEKRKTIYKYEYDNQKISLINKNFELIQDEIIKEQQRWKETLIKGIEYREGASIFTHLWRYIIQNVWTITGMILASLVSFLAYRKYSKHMKKQISVAVNVNHNPVGITEANNNGTLV